MPNSARDCKGESIEVSGVHVVKGLNQPSPGTEGSVHFYYPSCEYASTIHGLTSPLVRSAKRQKSRLKKYSFRKRLSSGEERMITRTARMMITIVQVYS